MKKMLCAVALVSLVSGCGDDSGSGSGSGSGSVSNKKETDLHGKWVFDVDKSAEAVMANDEDFKKLTPEERDEATKQMKESMKASSIEFTSDGKIESVRGPGPSTQVTYKIQSKDGKKWTIETQEEGKEAQTGTLEWIGDKDIKMSIEEKKGEKTKTTTFYLKR